MPHVRTRPAMALVCTLVCLSACASSTAGSLPPATATTTVAPTVTPTLAPAPTPMNVPAGWSVLDTTHFSLAYPPGWTTQTSPQQDGSLLYQLVSPEAQSPDMYVGAQAQVPSQGIDASYCVTKDGANQPTTLAGLPMAYNLTGEGQLNRTWTFANAQGTLYGMEADDVQSSSTTQALDTSIFATFRPDDADPWKC